jgi:hypothetical protein
VFTSKRLCSSRARMATRSELSMYAPRQTRHETSRYIYPPGLSEHLHCTPSPLTVTRIPGLDPDFHLV